LFSYLSRRHDERLKAEAQEEASLAQFQAYQEEPVGVFELADYELPANNRWEWEEGNSRYQVSTTRNLLAPSPARLPAARTPLAQPAAAHQRVTDYTLARQRGPGAETERNKSPEQHPAARRSGSYPAPSGRQTRSLRGIQQTAALKAARMEALQQSTDDEFFTPTSRFMPPVRNVDSSPLPPMPQSQRTPARQQAPGNGADHLPRSASQQAQPRDDPHTDKLAGRYPSTGPMRSQPQPGRMPRQPRLEAQPRNPEIITGSVKHPMVRRAPYLYEDDALREELAQQLDPPSVRRSSLYDQYEEE